MGWSAGGQNGGCDSGYLEDGVINGDGNGCSGHGTHCAGTIGGATYGVSKDVELVAVQVLSCFGSGSTAGVLAGIQWAVDDAQTRGKPAIISMSLGGGRSDSGGRAELFPSSVRWALARLCITTALVHYHDVGHQNLHSNIRTPIRSALLF